MDRQIDIILLMSSNRTILSRVIPHRTLARTPFYTDKLCQLDGEWVLVRRISKAHVRDTWENTQKEFMLLDSIRDALFLRTLHYLQNKSYLYAIFAFTHSSRAYSEVIFPSHTLSHTQIVDILASIVLSLEVLNANGYYHGNISPDTFRVVEQGSTTMVDIANIRPTTRKHPKTCKPMDEDCVYRAPEAFDPHYDQTTSVDMWSFGVLLYQAYFHKPPYEKYLCSTMLNKIHSIEYSSNQTVPKEAIELMKRLLRKPSERSRVSWGEVKKSSYFSGIKWGSFVPHSQLKELGLRKDRQPIPESIWIQMYEEKWEEASNEDKLKFKLFDKAEREEETNKPSISSQ